MQNAEVIYLVNKNAQRRRDAEELDRRQREWNLRLKRAEECRMLSRLAFMAAGGVGVLALAGCLLSLPGAAAVVGIVTTAVFYRIGDRLERKREEARWALES